MRDAKLPPQPERLRSFMVLHFGAVDEQGRVYLNGKPVGEHTVDSTGRSIHALWDEPFGVEVSRHLRTEGENVVVVPVHDAARMDGIWKPVHLVFSDMPLDSRRRREAVLRLTASATSPGTTEAP